MPRRNHPPRRRVIPDARYNSVTVQQTINKVLQGGKKGTAERIMYGALRRIEEQMRQDPLDVFSQAMRNITPQMEVKPRRVGGATYQVPVDIRSDRRGSLAIRWLVQAARNRKGRSMIDRLAQELMDAYKGQGTAVKKREDTHRMAEANRAFVHYRW